MKDVTGDVIKSLTSEEIQRRRSCTILGEKTEIPENIFKEMLSKVKYFEADDVQDINNNYDIFLKKTKQSMKVVMYNIKIIAKVSMRNRNFFKQHDILFKKHGDEKAEFMGDDVKITDFTMRNVKNHQIYIHDVKLENFKHITNPLFSGYKFDIVDRKNNRVEGVYVYEAFYDNAYSQSDETMIEKKAAIEDAKNSMPGTTFVLYATALDLFYLDSHLQRNPRNKRLLVRRIQGGGRGRLLPPPVIMVK